MVADGLVTPWNNASYSGRVSTERSYPRTNWWRTFQHLRLQNERRTVRPGVCFFPSFGSTDNQPAPKHSRSSWFGTPPGPEPPPTVGSCCLAPTTRASSPQRYGNRWFCSWHAVPPFCAVDYKRPPPTGCCFFYGPWTYGGRTIHTGRLRFSLLVVVELVDTVDPLPPSGSRFYPPIWTTLLAPPFITFATTSGGVLASPSGRL